jgi:isopentenyl-diphosphate delta-isomerase
MIDSIVPYNINYKMGEEVILVDADGREIGTMNKLEAHKKGLLHRAFSILIFNSRNEFLLQRRAEGKYHSGGLWSNTCCSHPRPYEDILSAAGRRLKEELGLSAKLEIMYHFIYKVDFPDGLSEHELDYVITGMTDELPVLNPEEASEWKYISYQDLKTDIDQNPDLYTYWFKIIIENFKDADFL